MKIADFRKYLQSLSKEEMEAELINLAKSYKNVEEYFYLKVNPANEEEIFLKYKENIKNQFFTKKSYGIPNFKEIREYYSEFKKVSKNTEYLIELMIYTVEMGIKYLEEVQPLEDRFYERVCKVFKDVTILINKNKYEEKYINRCKKIVESNYSRSYGLYDSMSDIFYDYFGVELD